MSQTQKVSCELWDTRTLRFQASKMDILKKEVEGWGSGPKATSGYTRQLNTQQNFKTCKTNWSLFFSLINLIYFFKTFLKFLFKNTNTDFSLQYVVCCIFQFVQCFKAQGCLCFQLYMGLKHPSFWQAGRRLNKNQKNKAD